MTPSQRIKILAHIERDLARHVRNQKLIDTFKHPTRRDRMMLHIEDNAFRYFLFGLGVFWLTAIVTAVHAEEGRIICPVPGQPCKVIVLIPQEEDMLMRQNGVLDTAAQGRSLELGQFAVYMKNKVLQAAQGQVIPLPEKKSETPVDKP